MRRAKLWWVVPLTLAWSLLPPLGDLRLGWGQPKYGGTLVMVHNDPDIMNPVATPGWIQFQRLAFNGLIDHESGGTSPQVWPPPGRFPTTA